MGGHKPENKKLPEAPSRPARISHCCLFGAFFSEDSQQPDFHGQEDRGLCRSQAAGCRLLKETKFATSEPGGPALDAVETQDVPIWGQDR